MGGVWGCWRAVLACDSNGYCSAMFFSALLICLGGRRCCIYLQARSKLFFLLMIAERSPCGYCDA
jgi:hypothetical protein